ANAKSYKHCVDRRTLLACSLPRGKQGAGEGRQSSAHRDRIARRQLAAIGRQHALDIAGHARRTMNGESSITWLSPATQTSGGSAMTITLTSPAFQAEKSIPKQYTGDGADQSPPLKWSEPPAGTKSIALICDDPD